MTALATALVRLLAPRPGSRADHRTTSSTATPSPGAGRAANTSLTRDSCASHAPSSSGASCGLS